SEPCFRVTVVEDISDRRRAEQALLAATDEAIRARAEAERAALTRSRFIAAASHDLRQPVQSLLLLIGVLKERSAGMPAAQIAEHMERALDALKMLLNSILDVSKLDAGIIVPDIRDVPMSQLMGRLLEEYRWRAQEKRLDLRAVETTAVVRTDSALIERMVRNLIENAIRYTPPGGKVLVGCRRLGGWLRIDVADNGIGISEDQHEAVFVEFHQIGNPERDRGQGIGLGLAIVRRIARLLGGDVAVSSTFGKGSRFSLTVPLSRPEASG
ncbi:MAG: HAMP domain-containing histidine kinase, partial [Rhodospirillales bacterium]|nr:HAMP domain-containing histidine kinase [Rhodospirillales bacterium]